MTSPPVATGQGVAFEGSIGPDSFDRSVGF
jgi:hypothetical protein